MELQTYQTEEMIQVSRTDLEQFAEMLNAFQNKYFGENQKLNFGDLRNGC